MRPPALNRLEPSVTPLRAPGHSLSPAQLARLVRETATARQQWQTAVQFSARRRWYRRLAITDDYETWLLTWLPGQRTGFHDHGDASGAFAVVQGDLRETLASPLSTRIRYRTARLGSVTSFGGEHLHDVANVGSAPAVSIHAYSPPLSAMRQYELTDSGLTVVRTDRAEVDW